MATVLLDGLAIGESPRWHEGRLWLCNWTTGQVLAVDVAGRSTVVAQVDTTVPYSIDWRPDGTLLVVSGQEGTLLRQEPDGSLVTLAELTSLSPVFNEIVVDQRGNAYVNGTVIAVVRPDGTARQVAEDLAFGNGMAITPDGRTLIVAESHAHRLTAFTIEDDATLMDRRLDRGAFACMLGGDDGTTLFIHAARWRGMEHLLDAEATGQLLVERVGVPHAGRP